MRKITILFLITLCLSCKEEKQIKFSLTGTTNSIEDGTLLFLDIESHNILDSTIVVDNKFAFERNLPEPIVTGILRTKDFSHYRFIWLENKHMTFDASNTDFRNAKITGSESEALSQKLYNLVKEVEPHSKEQREIEQKFINNNPNSIVSANILATYSTTWGKETTEKLFNNFSLENKNTLYGKEIASFIELNKNPRIGDYYVDFEMKNTTGKTLKLSDNLGKLTLLEFWSSNCAPCKKENPNLIKTYNRFNSFGFEIFAVSHDIDKEKWIKAIETDKLAWIHVSDLKRSDKASLIYGINGIPDNFLINEEGIIVGRNLRGEKLNNKIIELIGD